MMSFFGHFIYISANSAFQVIHIVNRSESCLKNDVFVLRPWWEGSFVPCGLIIETKT